MGAGGEVAFLYRLASHLRKSVAEILDFSENELMGWAAFLQDQSPRSSGKWR